MKKVLLVDDSDFARIELKKDFESQGFKVLEAANGREALAMLATDIDLIVLDYSMPGMTGVEFAKKVRGIPEYSSLPIVFLSAQGNLVQKQEAKEAGVIGWVLKPATGAAVLNLVRQRLDKI